MPLNSKKEEMKLRDMIDPSRLPVHVAIIMDGNGRWAKRHSFPRIRGHRQGIRAVRDTVRACRSLGVKVLSLYAFSEENWKRPQSEVNALMSLLTEYLVKERKELSDRDIKLIATGNIEKLPQYPRAELGKTMDVTKSNSSMILNLALSYSGRDEIIRAIKQYVNDLEKNEEKAALNQDTFRKYLDTANLPDPDLLVRTSGEQRISNFMLWQLAYTEIYVTDVLWPDFRKSDLYKAIIEFQKRERRFGLLSEQVTNPDFAEATF